MAFRRFCPAARRGALVAALVGLAACGSSGSRPFPARAPVWSDTDRQPIETEPSEYFSPFVWDGANQTIFRPLSRFFAADPAGLAVNVNAIDEVPNSSWFTNRIGWFPMTPQQVATGPCDDEGLSVQGPWIVTGAKPNGANPGFPIQAPDGRRYMIKFDGTLQGPRATAADVIGSKIYHAAGYFAPCNEVVFFDRAILSIKPGATAETPDGTEEPLTLEHINKVLRSSVQLPDGRYRASSSLYLPGKPIGPWRYESTRSDDANDIIDHDDRRDLRGMKLLAAWLNHFDSREQNTLAMWISAPGGGGHVRHNMLDFGDCFGSIWEPPMLGRRIGHANYLDLSDLAQDFLTLGIRNRPWDEARFGASGAVFGYFNVEQFVAEDWKPGYPNPAFTRMGEHDAAWMARIMSQFTDEHLHALVSAGKMNDPRLDAELFRILRGRLDKILRRYMGRLSPLARPVLSHADEQSVLCLEDLSTSTGGSEYYAGTFRTTAGGPARHLPGKRVMAEICFATGPLGRAYWTLDVPGPRPDIGALRVHLASPDDGDPRVVGLERFEPGALAPLP